MFVLYPGDMKIFREMSGNFVALHLATLSMPQFSFKLYPYKEFPAFSAFCLADVSAFCQV